jgi:acetyl-CoA carboxylase biotin carboxylase subunit
VWEEAPAACLDAATRARLCGSAARLAESVGYRGAGALEYLYDAASGAFYFLEMNTRIQVEHPVTEMVTGVDLIVAMIRIAFGEPLGVAQEAVPLSGHAIEVRVNAEDPANGFMPFPGVVGAMSVPAGVRFDTMLYEGYVIPPFYDSLLGKLIVHGATRESALAALREAIAAMRLEGLRTTLPLHAALARDPAVIAGRTHTRFLETWLETATIEAV